jgi:hypothetical protein
MRSGSLERLQANLGWLESCTTIEQQKQLTNSQLSNSKQTKRPKNNNNKQTKQNKNTMAAIKTLFMFIFAYLLALASAGQDVNQEDGSNMLRVR